MVLRLVEAVSAASTGKLEVKEKTRAVVRRIIDGRLCILEILLIGSDKAQDCFDEAS
jgi:hypothetical protein